MPVESYGVWKAKPLRYTYETNQDDPNSPHLSLYYSDGEGPEGRAAINIKSGDRNESRLSYWTVPKFQHPITQDLVSLNPGFRLLAGTPEQGRGGLALDFIRGNLFQRSEGRILPHDVAGNNNDILDQLKPIIDGAIAAGDDATVYIYGSAFDDGKGIHNVHMNQGNPQRWSRDNGVWQDGGLLIQFADHWEAVFIGFASQAVHTDDGPSDAGQPLPRTGYLTWANFLAGGGASEPDRNRDDLGDTPVVITGALVNPEGPDGQPDVAPETVTLMNRTNSEVDLSGWRIRNKAGESHEISGLGIAGGATVTVTLVARVPLSNKGGTITLLNKSGLKVHGVSYSKEQAEEGVVVAFS